MNGFSPVRIVRFGSAAIGGSSREAGAGNASACPAVTPSPLGSAFWRSGEAEGFGGLAELVKIGRAAGIVEQEALAEGRVIEDVERHRLATHQVDEILPERVAQQMRDARRRKAHEVAGS